MTLNITFTILIKLIYGLIKIKTFNNSIEKLEITRRRWFLSMNNIIIRLYYSM